MKNFKIKNAIYVLVITSAIVWFLLASISGLDLSTAKDFFSLIPKVVSIDLLVVFVFTKWFWKVKIFRGWLVPFPNLHGTWEGKIYSNWINQETNEPTDPIPVMLTVNQSFSHISCIMHTSEMKSYSLSEGFTIDDDRQLKQLSYIYSSIPRISLNHRSTTHSGAIIFDIIESPERKLNGRYWTERQTNGEINLKFYSKKVLEELPESYGSHPVTEPSKIR